MLPDFYFCKDAFEKYGLELNPDTYEKFDIYADFLVEYNKKVNLTAITDPVEILYKHFIDSVVILKFCDISPESHIIDVGTGAGFPSVPLKIYMPSLRITLLDSLNKRISFLQQLADSLKLTLNLFTGVPRI